jgi:hypothetical protein
MFNLAAGPGASYDTFDLVAALMLEATGFLATEGVQYPPGVHQLPRKVQDRARGTSSMKADTYCNSFLRLSSRYSAVTEPSGA